MLIIRRHSSDAHAPRRRAARAVDAIITHDSLDGVAPRARDHREGGTHLDGAGRADDQRIIRIHAGSPSSWLEQRRAGHADHPGGALGGVDAPRVARHLAGPAGARLVGPSRHPTGTQKCEFYPTRATALPCRQRALADAPHPAAQPRWAIVHQGAPPRSIQLPRRVDSFEPPQHVPEDDESQEEAEDGMVAEDGMLADDEGASTSDDVESDGGLFPMDEAEDAAGTPPPSGGRRRAVAWPWRKEWRP